MYNLYEIAFFILYFVFQTIKTLSILLAIQIIVYKITGFSIYKFLMKITNKLITEDF